MLNSYFTDTVHDNGYGEPVADPTAFHGNSHDVYAPWDFNDVWLADLNNFPTLRQPEEPLEELSEGYQVWDANDMDGAQSNNVPTLMILYQNKFQRPDLQKLSRDFAKQLADPIIKQVLSKEPATKYAA